MDKGYIDKLIAILEKSAEEADESYRLSGGYGSGGDSIREQIKFYRHGQAGTIPPDWVRASYLLDPDWEDYERLKKKFKDVIL